MVHTGKPSRGCQTCRTRRVKCDEARPRCGNCNKAGRKCFGFPDNPGLVFRNENPAAVRRAKRTGTKASSSSGNLYSGSVSSNTTYPKGDGPPACLASQQISGSSLKNDSQISSSLYFFAVTTPTSHMPKGLHIPREEQAIAFFFRRFASSPHEAGGARGFLSLVLPYYNSTSSSSALHQATYAVSLCTMGNYPGRSYLMEEATKFHASALRRVRETLTDIAQAKTDETMISVMMLAFYEAICPSEHSISTWAHHVDGAITLARLRGPEQFRHDSSKRLFQAVRSLMVTRAIQWGNPIERFLKDWTTEDETPVNQLIVIAMGLAEIRRCLRTLMTGVHNPNRAAEAWSLIEAAKEVDTSLRNRLAALPENWSPKTVAVEHEMPETLEELHRAERWVGPVYAYADVWTSHALNGYRMVRIFTQSVIMACCSVLSADLSDPKVLETSLSARFIIQSMADEFCGGIPFHTGLDTQNGPTSNLDPNAAEAEGSFTLVWHAFVCSKAPCISDKQRHWIQGRLIHIGRRLGFDFLTAFTTAFPHILDLDCNEIQSQTSAISESESTAVQQPCSGVSSELADEITYSARNHTPDLITMTPGLFPEQSTWQAGDASTLFQSETLVSILGPTRSISDVAQPSHLNEVRRAAAVKDQRGAYSFLKHSGMWGDKPFLDDNMMLRFFYQISLPMVVCKD